jgi:putative PIN family toxin of toxin-antitoxin system
VRLTLDTNQLVRALMRPPQLATFVMAWEARRFDVVCSLPLLEEYERVLAYPEVARLIFPELLRAFRSHLRADMQIIPLPDVPRICRDPEDDKVIATAVFGRVDYLVTEDEDLRAPKVVEALEAAGIKVISAQELIAVLDATGH